MGSAWEAPFHPTAVTVTIKVWPGFVAGVNLIINARDAIPNGGHLVIESANAELDVDRTLANQAHVGKYVIVMVSDNGCGMSAETKSHIFEPFFTTKEQGNGTGLGLAIVFGIVKQSGGQISVHSEPDIGTTFKIYFPFVETEIHMPGVEEEHQQPITGVETILLVEDEDGVRDSAAEYLRESGYTVLTAKGGPEALELAEQYGRPIHLLLTDLIMPLMSGRELSEKMAGICSEIRVVFMSGYSNNLLSYQQVLAPRHVLLQKPFRLATLGRRIREVLGGSQAATAGR
jgi:two-component system, cell cycle sensor histidine kinase and response regulator CckA